MRMTRLKDFRKLKLQLLKAEYNLKITMIKMHGGKGEFLA